MKKSCLNCKKVFKSNILEYSGQTYNCKLKKGMWGKDYTMSLYQASNWCCDCFESKE